MVLSTNCIYKAHTIFRANKKRAGKQIKFVLDTNYILNSLA